MDTAAFSTSSTVATAAPRGASAGGAAAGSPLLGLSAPPQAASEAPAIVAPAKRTNWRRAYLLVIEVPLSPRATNIGGTCGVAPRERTRDSTAWVSPYSTGG